MVRWKALPLSLLALCSVAGAQVHLHAPLPKLPIGRTLYAATADDFGSGGVVAIHGGSPWLVEPLATTDGGLFLRLFGEDLFVVNMMAGTITRLRLEHGGAPQVFDLGATSEPQDVHVVGGAGWVSRRHDPVLLRIDLATGVSAPATDLGVLAAPGESLSLGTMERDGNRLFVQVTLTHESGFARPFNDRAVLAVVALPGGTLLDVDPLQTGVQGVALDGAPPQHKMQILDEVRTLYVSTTGSSLDSRGGIEMVNLQTLRSVGYALSEEVIGDLGGFVMTSPAGGYFVFHTDLTVSTHLMPFTVAGGPAPGPEMIVLFDLVDTMVFDAKRKRIYLPGGFGGTSSPGLHVFSTLTNAPIAGSPIDTGMGSHDVVQAGK